MCPLISDSDRKLYFRTVATGSSKKVLCIILTVIAGIAALAVIIIPPAVILTRKSGTATTADSVVSRRIKYAGVFYMWLLAAA